MLEMIRREKSENKKNIDKSDKICYTLSWFELFFENGFFGNEGSKTTIKTDVPRVWTHVGTGAGLGKRPIRPKMRIRPLAVDNKHGRKAGRWI